MKNVIIFTTIAMVSYALGEAYSKFYADTSKMKYAIWAVILYTITSALWLPVLKAKNELAVMSAIWTVLYVVLGVLVGVFMFGEKISTFNMIGIFLSLAAIFFLCF